MVAGAESPHRQHGGEHPALLPAAGGSDDGRAHADGAAHPAQAFREFDVFHQGLLWHAAGGGEQAAVDEHALIAGADVGGGGAEVHGRRHHTHSPIDRVEGHVAAAPCGPIGDAPDCLHESAADAAVGVQEQQPVVAPLDGALGAEPQLMPPARLR